MLITEAFLTYFFLFLPFLLFYLVCKNKNGKRIFVLICCFLLCALPLTYCLIDNSLRDYQDANIGLGFAFIFTWILTAIPYFVLIGVLINKKSKK